MCYSVVAGILKASRTFVRVELEPLLFDAHLPMVAEHLGSFIVIMKCRHETWLGGAPVLVATCQVTQRRGDGNREMI